MPRKPDEATLKAKDVKLDPVQVLEATINAMNDPGLEQRLVDAGVAVKIEE